MPLLWEPDGHSWRQGAIIPADLPGLDVGKFSLNPAMGPDDLLVLISQDCDICCRSFKDEPFAELLVGRRSTATVPDGNFAHGKNPRRLELTIEQPGGPRVYTFFVRERQFILRSLLAETDRAPSGGIGDANIATTRQWMARRYTRSALPTNFNARTRSQRDKIAQRLKPLGVLVRSIHLKLNSLLELPNDEAYGIDVIILIDPKGCPDPPADKRVTEFVGTILEELDACPGIDVGKVEALLPRDITLEEVSELLRWEDPEYLSYQDGTPDSLTPRDF